MGCCCIKQPADKYKIDKSNEINPVKSIVSSAKSSRDRKYQSKYTSKQKN
jgi:hypothetical protein